MVGTEFSGCHDVSLSVASFSQAGQHKRRRGISPKGINKLIFVVVTCCDDDNYDYEDIDDDDDYD